MNLENVEYYNVGAVEAVPGFGPNGLMRVPEPVRNSLNNRARFVAMDSVGCEARFVTDAPNIEVYLACTKPEFADMGEMRVYRGNFLYQSHPIEPGRLNSIRLVPPEAFQAASRETINDGGFSSEVWRLVFNRGATFVLHGLDTHGYEIRPPRVDEKPERNWLAYGSSITNSNLDGYAHIAARRLRVQVQNKGLSGACHIEKEMVDYLVDDCQWDVATCELGVNMRGCFTPEEFEARASYLIDRFAATGKPVLIISVFPNGRTPGLTAEPNLATLREEAFNASIASLVQAKQAANLHLLEGREVLDDFTGLSGDLLHPSAYGHAIMGVNLAERLRSLI